MFCDKCGKQVEDTAKFCENCGAEQTIPIDTSDKHETQEKTTEHSVDTARMQDDKTTEEKPGLIAKILAMIILLVMLGLVIKGGSWLFSTVLFPDKKDGTGKQATDVVDGRHLTGNSFGEGQTETTTVIVTTKGTETTNTVKTTVTEKQEKAEVSENYQTYLSLLNILVLEIEEEYTNQLTYRSYYLYDINHDGILELLVHVGDGEATASIGIYSLDETGELMELGEIGGGHTYLTEKNGNLYSNFGYKGYQVVKEIQMVGWHDVWSIVEEMVSEQEGLSDYTGHGTGIKGYDISDKSAVEKLLPKDFLENKPYVDAYVETYGYSGYVGCESRLYVDGDFSYILVQRAEDYGNDEFNIDAPIETYTKAECADYINLNFNAPANPPTFLYITPCSDSGVVGDMVFCEIPQIANGTISSGGLTYSTGDKKGQINCHGGTIAGFTTEYVVNGGTAQKVRSSLGDTWHVTAKNACINYDITWYELWDTDDGDYYGWVDSSYIDFYG